VSSRRSVSPPHAPAQRRWPNEVGEMAILATCRAGCGACCIAPSISPCASLPDGKPADVRCPHLTSDLRCALFGRPERPATCVSLRPQPEMCGESGRGDRDVDRVGEADAPRFHVERRWLTAEPFTAWASVTLDPCTTFC
jgi:hypothetical protein